VRPTFGTVTPVRENIQPGRLLALLCAKADVAAERPASPEATPCRDANDDSSAVYLMTRLAVKSSGQRCHLMGDLSGSIFESRSDHTPFVRTYSGDLDRHLEVAEDQSIGAGQAQSAISPHSRLCFSRVASVSASSRSRVACAFWCRPRQLQRPRPRYGPCPPTPYRDSRGRGFQVAAAARQRLAAPLARTQHNWKQAEEVMCGTLEAFPAIGDQLAKHARSANSACCAGNGVTATTLRRR
jgi:hypothetical protein